MNWDPRTWFGTETKTGTDVSLNTLIQRLEAAYLTGSGVSVTPESCMRSPTVQAIVTAVSRRISVSPVHIFQKSFVNHGRERKERLPNHPVEKLLQNPNEYQTRVSYWLDATSSLMRYGRYFAYKARGKTGPIRRLHPLHADSTCIEQDSETLDISYRSSGHQQREFTAEEVHYVRGAARDFLKGDSPVNDVREAIALEIAAEQFGSTFFGNGATPFLFFKLMQGFQGFKTTEESDKFISDFKMMFSGARKHSAYMLPKGLELDQVHIENEKAQFLETRKLQRTIIAGAFGVPPHFVGDLERATFNNVEQQDTDFVINVVMPIAQLFEAAMERDLLTADDRSSGVIIRFNLDAIQRADFKSRQEGLQIMRQNGVINANDWRETGNQNPIADDDGGEDFIRPANFVVAGEEPPPQEPPSAAPDPNSPA